MNFRYATVNAVALILTALPASFQQVFYEHIVSVLDSEALQGQYNCRSETQSSGVSCTLKHVSVIYVQICFTLFLMVSTGFYVRIFVTTKFST